EENAKSYIKRFKEEQEKYHVRIAVGYAYEKNISDVPIMDMFSRADKMMYDEKAKIKGLNY
nr:hypothetical protein [Bacillota bacterium]